MHLTYLQAVVIGLIQGLTELFPISSLGHVVLVPAWLGGSWAALVHEESSSESPYLAFVVGLHLATAAVLVAYYWREWVRLIRGFVTSIVRRRIESADERLAWLIVVATIPVGFVGLVLEHSFRVLFAKPAAAAIFLTINGGILILGERYWRRERRRTAAAAAAAPVAPAARPAAMAAAVPGPVPEPPAPVPAPAGDADDATIDQDAQRRLAGIGLVSALWIGASQVLALFAGISREGVTMVGGLSRGLSHEDAMRFSFLLSTPVILAAGLLKLPDLAGPLGNGIRGPVIAGSVAAAASSALAVIFLARYFRTRTLTPFAIYCLAAGLISIIRFTVF
ncbi:MAG TPA: undecaprenyl-diphosphate phosphatase [Streptosporangiaceae bacterium]|nr:undecaprenyl-diphosphate phosphatase [Streptosporangiaceae bacterium]